LLEFQHHLKDVRFLGTPVDFVVFDGLDAGAVEKIAFIKVTTEASPLLRRELRISHQSCHPRQAVESERRRFLKVLAGGGDVSRMKGGLRGQRRGHRCARFVRFYDGNGNVS